MYQNRVSLIGFLGNAPELKTIKGGTALALFCVATKASWKNGNGGYDSRTDWHRCAAFGSLADFIGKLEKGVHVKVEGGLRYREYEKDYGTKKKPLPVKHRVAEIHVSRVLKLDRAGKQEEPSPEVAASDIPADEPRHDQGS
ncbi:MAG TPA: single-stranded DNA-binding protein [Terriglobales bacterium]